MNESKLSNLWRFKAFIIAFICSSGANDFEAWLLIYIVVKIKQECEFTSIYSVSTIATLIFQILGSRPLSAYLVDKHSSKLRLFMLIATVIQILCLIALFFIPKDEWVLVYIDQCLRNFGNVLYNTCLWKSLKNRIEYKCRYRTGEQSKLITLVAMCSQMLEYLILLACFFAIYNFVGTMPQFNHAMYVYVAATLMFTVGQLFCVPLIDVPIPDGVEALDDAPLDDPFKSALDFGFANNLQPNNASLNPVEGAFDTLASWSASDDDNDEYDSSSMTSVPVDRRVDAGTLVNDLFGTGLKRGAVLHGFLCLLGTSVLSNAEKLALPGRHNMPGQKTPGNLCGGYFKGSALSATLLNVFFLVASSIYMFALRRIAPLPFFRLFFPLFALLLLLAAIMLAPMLNSPDVVLFASSSLLEAGLWFMYLYSFYLALSSTPSRSAAAVNSLFGGFYAFSQVLVSVVVIWIGADSTFFLWALWMTIVISLCVSIFFSIQSKRALKSAGLGY